MPCGQLCTEELIAVVDDHLDGALAALEKILDASDDVRLMDVYNSLEGERLMWLFVKGNLLDSLRATETGYDNE